MKTDYDVLIIGSGASGGMAAYTLTKRACAASCWTPDRRSISSTARTLRAVYDLPYRGFGRPGRFPHVTQASEFDANLWADEKQNPYTYPTDDPYYWVRIRLIGGKTLRWGRASWRLSDFEFKCKDHDGFGENWPISYADLAPYYDRVEPIFRVAGRNEGFRQIPDGKSSRRQFARQPQRAALHRVGEEDGRAHHQGAARHRDAGQFGEPAAAGRAGDRQADDRAERDRARNPGGPATPGW